MDHESVMIGGYLQFCPNEGAGRFVVEPETLKKMSRYSR